MTISVLTDSDLRITPNSRDFPGLMERLMVPSDTWDVCGCPAEVVAMAVRASTDGIPTGLAKHPVYGWHMLMAGQGPMIAWADGDEIPPAPSQTCGVDLVPGGVTVFSMDDAE